MNWKDVGGWVKDHAGSGASLVGALVTGNIPGAVAAGVSMIKSATGEDSPEKAMSALQSNPEILLKMKEIALKNDESIRKHLEAMTKLEMEDKQKEHHETQQTIRQGDKADDVFVRRTRPSQSWVSLFAAICYVFVNIKIDGESDMYILGLLLTLPFAYAGLREVGKGSFGTLFKK